MNKFLFFLILIFTGSGIACQDFNPQSIDSIFDSWNNTDTPGGAVSIIKGGAIVFQKGYGIADLEHDIVNNPSTVFYIGSVSKQFVAFCILLLEEEGKIDLDTPIQTYLPDFPDYGSTLTIRHFIHHLSGIRDYLTLMDLKGRSYLDHLEKEEVYDLIISQKELNFVPGEQYLYSNSCYFMLALIIEKVSGMPLSVYAKQNIFDPLGMVNSVFHDDVTHLIKNRAFSYQKTANGFDNLVLRFDLVGSGGMYSNLTDLYLWDQNFKHNKLGKGGQEIIERMMTDGSFNNGTSCGYAFAVVNGNYKGLKTLGHGGALAGYRSHFVRFPDQDVSIIILSNRSDAATDKKAYDVADIVLKDYFKTVPQNKIEPEKAADPDQIASFDPAQIEGMFEIEPGINIKFFYSNGTLKGLQLWDSLTIDFVNLSGNEFTIKEDQSIRFVFSDLKEGKASKITVTEGNNITVLNRVLAYENKRSMNEYSGEYYCKELNTSYQLYVKDNRLFVDIPGTKALELLPSQKDQFNVRGRGAQLRFITEEHNTIAFRLDAGRVKNLYFQKMN